MAQLDVPRLVRRAVLIWLPLRLMITPVCALAPGCSPSWFLPPGSAAILIIVTTVMCHIDARVMREPVFFANLGRPPWAVAAVTAAVVIVVELLSALIGAA